MSKKILAERGKGQFKDWADFEKRVQGVGEKSAMKLSAAGLQVNGKARDGAPMGKAEAKPSKTAATPAADKARPADKAKPASKAAM